jgi:hypothetical protein
MAGKPVMVVERDAYGPFQAGVTAATDDDGRFDVSLRAADGGTGVRAYRLLHAQGPHPPGQGQWAVAGEGAWAAEPLGGEMSVAYAGPRDTLVYLALQAQDRAGNWSAVPQAPMATVAVGAVAPSPTAPPPTPTRPSETQVPPSSRTPSELRPRAALPLGLAAAPVPERGTRRPTRTATPTAAATYTASATPAPATATPPATATAQATPGCTAVPVVVSGPRGVALAPGTGAWMLRAYRQGVPEPEVSQQPLGTPGCVAFTPERLEGVGLVDGYVSFPPQNLRLSDLLVLAVAPNGLSNGGFEAGLAGWTLTGQAAPQSSRDALAGSGAALLGRGAPAGPASVESAVAQEVVLPARQPTVNFRALFTPRPTCDQGGCVHADRIDVIVEDLSAAGQPPTLVTPPDGLREPIPEWGHLWYDLAPWAGRRVRLTVALHQTDGIDPSVLLLDNVAVGMASP